MSLRAKGQASFTESGYSRKATINKFDEMRESTEKQDFSINLNKTKEIQDKQKKSQKSLVMQETVKETVSNFLTQRYSSEDSDS